MCALSECLSVVSSRHYIMSIMDYIIETTDRSVTGGPRLFCPIGLWLHPGRGPSFVFDLERAGQYPPPTCAGATHSAPYPLLPR